MRNIILSTLAGLVIGTVGALAYSYFADAGKFADLQAQLDAANASLAKAAHDKQQLAAETSGAADQVDQLVKSNEDLKQQLDDLKKKADPATATTVNPVTLADMMRSMMRGGIQTQQRLFLLKSRLHLTQDQATAIQTAMEADAAQRRQLMRQMFRGGGNGGGNGGGGNVDPQAAPNANTLEQTLASVLTPEQKTAYQQVEEDENSSRANTAAAIQMNQVAPLLQLSDSQKDQVFSALYQVQVSAPDPATLITNPNATSLITTQAQATQAALAKVLTPDQMALYQQEAQAVGNGGGGFGGGGRDGGGGGGAAAPAAPATPAPAQ